MLTDHLKFKFFREESGFSLVELVIMVMILGITLIPLTSLSINNIRNTGRQIEMTRAIMYAEEGVEHVWAFYADSRPGANKGYDGFLDGYFSFSAINGELESGYSRSAAISGETTTDGVNTIEVTVSVGCPSGETVSMTVMLTDL